MRLFMRTRARAAPGLAEARARAPPCSQRGIGAGSQDAQVRFDPPVTFDLVGIRFTLLGGGGPWVVLVRPDPLGVRPVHDQRRRPIRIGGGEEAAHRSALGVPEQRSSVRSDRVHHRADIVHAGFEIGETPGPIRQAGAALVEADQPRERREPLQEMRRARLFPVILEVRHPARHEDKIERPITDHLVGDIDVATLRVVGFRRWHGSVNHPLATDAADWVELEGRADQRPPLTTHPRSHRVGGQPNQPR